MKYTLLAVVAVTLSCAPRGDAVRSVTPGDQGDEAAVEHRSQAEDPGSSEPDNDVCLVCHLDYEEEPMVVTHARGGIGCADCHGSSWDHADDEGHEIAPEIMYPLSAIDPACRKCHATHEATAREILARWQECCTGKRDPAKAVCTDCHGRHRLERRTVRWNRTTGELVPQDGEAEDEVGS